MDCTLTVLDTAGIQSYIFNSNELRENIGASHLVYQATTHWVLKVLNKQGVGVKKHNYIVDQNEDAPYTPQFLLEAETVNDRAEIVYAGGGNIVILFAGDTHDTTAKQFVYELSKKIIAEAPGLQLYAAHQRYTWGDNLAEAVDKAMQELAKLKTHMPVYMPTLGLSVTAACTSTGLPANGEHLDPDKSGKAFDYQEEENGRATLANRANRQVITQWYASRDAKARLRKMFPLVEKEKFNWTDNLNKIGELPGRDESYVAVIHADGNGMGKRILVLNNVFAQFFPNQPRAYINAMRELSQAFRQTAKTALIKTVEDLVQTLVSRKNKPNGEVLYHIGRSKDGSDYPCFPLRPVVFGGDDVTLITAGAWGVDVAHRYLTHLENGNKLLGFDTLLPAGLDAEIQEAAAYAQAETVPWEETVPFACAGISIVKTHYPISRAYENSEALAKSAKKMVLAYRDDKLASSIDWHFTTTGLAGNLQEIRAREYEATEHMSREIGKAVENELQYPLPMRPLMLSDKYTWRNWDNFLVLFTRFENDWANGRNKMMALRETLHEGPMATADFEILEKRSKFLHDLGEFSSKSGLGLKQKNGWVTWQDEGQAVSHLQQWQNSQLFDVLERELNEVRCVYFDAIELQDHFLRLD